MEEILVLPFFRKDMGLAAVIGDADVVVGLVSHFFRPVEEWFLVAADIMEIVNSLVGHIRATDEEVVHPVAVMIYRQWDAPEADAKIHGSVRAIAERLCRRHVGHGLRGK